VILYFPVVSENYLSASYFSWKFFSIFRGAIGDELGRIAGKFIALVDMINKYRI
jgi:hypothetical protein